MNNFTSNPDWSLLQSFAAVAEHGSLSAAARAGGGSQPTMSRHIRQLEERLGARLFERTRSGVALTNAGLSLAAHARVMADAAAQMSIRPTESATLTGTVRITASEIVATYLLPDILTALHREEPGLAIEVVASDETDNLLRRRGGYRDTHVQAAATGCDYETCRRLDAWCLCRRKLH